MIVCNLPFNCFILLLLFFRFRCIQFPLFLSLLSRSPNLISFCYQVDIAIVAASADGTSHLWIVRGDTGKLTDYPLIHLHLLKPLTLFELSVFDYYFIYFLT